MRILNSSIKKVVLPLSLTMLLLAGCGADKDRTTKISIDKDGVVVNTIFEDFSQDYYDVSELSDMATEEISYYNSEYITPKITLTEVTKLEDEPYVKMVMTYDSASDYSHFNQSQLFYGTVQEAMDKGYELSAGLVNNEGEKIDLGSSDFLDRHVVITSEKLVVDTPFNIEYMSNGVSLKDKNIQNKSLKLLTFYSLKFI